MGRHTPRRVVSALYTKPPWVPVLVRTVEKWKRAYVLRQADRKGHCLVSVTAVAPESDPIMVPLSTIRIPTRCRFARKTLDTRPYKPIMKPRDGVEGGSNAYCWFTCDNGQVLMQARNMRTDPMNYEGQRVAMGDASTGSSTPLALLRAHNQDARVSSSGHNRDQDDAGV